MYSAYELCNYEIAQLPTATKESNVTFFVTKKPTPSSVKEINRHNPFTGWANNEYTGTVDNILS